MKHLVFILTFLLPLVVACKKEATIGGCHSGFIIGSIRSGGGGPALSLNTTAFGKHKWRGYSNVVEALNLPDELYDKGNQKIYFEGRFATQEEQHYIITADGDESDKPIIYITRYSLNSCDEL